MKMVILVVGTLLMASCASPSKKTVPQAAEAQPVSAAQSGPGEVQVCQQFVSEVLQKAVYYDGLQYRFLEEEAQALAFINGFGPEKIVFSDFARDLRQLKQSCELPQYAPAQVCAYHFPLYSYFNGLLYGVKEHDWSKATKKKAITLVLEHARLMALKETNLVDLSMAIDLIDRLASEHAPFKRQRHPLRALKKESDRRSEALREEFQLIRAQGLGCQVVTAMLEGELALVRDLSKRFSEILKSM
jgi:hypothetical protein